MLLAVDGVALAARRAQLPSSQPVRANACSRASRGAAGLRPSHTPIKLRAGSSVTIVVQPGALQR